MKILVINCGSSSLKYQLLNMNGEEVLASGLVERIGIDGSRIVHKLADGTKKVTESEIKEHKKAFNLVMNELTNADYGVIKSIDEIDAVGHRIVHGGEKFTKSVIINDEVMTAIEECCELAPLHNPANIIGIKACRELMGDVKMVAVFDTSFHQTMPEESYLYAIPYKYYTDYKIRRYGFHGTSHKYVSERTVDLCNLDKDNSKVIVCHLGNGGSVSAVKNMKSIDTSMGFTPLEGLVMGTRSGDIDPAIVEFIADKENKTAKEVVNILNKESGVYGLSTFTSDFRDLEDGVENKDERSIRALAVFNHRLVKYIGSYIALLNGVDAITFTAGLGENGADMRKEVCEALSYFGIEIDEEANKKRGEEIIISKPNSKIKVCVIPTNEELAIARDTLSLVK